MAKQNNHRQFNEDYFLGKGFTKNKDGSFSPPKFRNPFSINISERKEEPLELIQQTFISKQKINNSPDFEVKPPTEWFIKNYNVPSKKNSRQNFVKNGKQISIPSKNHAAFVKLTDMQFKVFGNEFRKSMEHYKLTYPIHVEFTFVRNSKRRFDYCNAAQTIEDLMVSNNWIEDDSADHIIPVFKLYEYDKETPGVKIKLITK